MTDLRQVYFNGQLIGEVPNTGDHEVDLLASKQLLDDHGLLHELSPIQATFQQAYSFAALSAQVYRQHLVKVPRQGGSLVPFVVNSAFAIELYLKTVARIYGSALRGHDLLGLFDALPALAHAELERTLLSCTTSDIQSMSDFRTALEKMRKLFVEWRYLHEGGSAAEVHFPTLILILEVLHNTCRQRDEIRGIRT